MNSSIHAAETGAKIPPWQWHNHLAQSSLINKHAVVWVVPGKEVVNGVIGFGDAASDGNVDVGSGDAVVDDWVDISVGIFSAIVTDNVVFRFWAIFVADCVGKL